MSSKRLSRMFFSFSLAAAVLGSTAALSRAADFSGEYKNAQVDMNIVAGSAGAYTGTIQIGSQSCPMKAQVDASGNLQGTFTSQGQDFTFTANLNGDQLAVQTGGATLQLARANAPINPLAGGNSQPPAQAPNPIAGNANNNSGGSATGNGDDPVALTREGNKYYYGDGVAEDDAHAMQLFQKASDDGYAPAMNQLGSMYQDGKGVAENDQLAMQWYQKAAAAGDADSMNNIGWTYRTGKGFPVDYAQAMQWYEKAADAGSAVAMNSLGLMYNNGQGTAKDPQQAFSWFQKAANAGSAAGMFDTAWAYENGAGTQQDMDQAMSWYRKAAAAGNESAKQRLAAAAQDAPNNQQNQNQQTQNQPPQNQQPQTPQGQFPEPQNQPALNTPPAAQPAAQPPANNPMNAPSTPPAAAPSGDAQPIDVTVTPTDKLVVDVDSGDVKVTTWDQPQVEVVIHKLLSEQNPQDADFYKRFNINVAKNAGEVDFTAKMPPDQNNNVNINTSGSPYLYEIKVPAKQSVQIKASMSTVTIVGTAGPLSVVSEMGDINAALPASAAFSLDAAGGQVSCDFPVPAGSDPTKLHGDVNGGGPAVSLKSQMGNIKITKQ